MLRDFGEKNEEREGKLTCCLTALLRVFTVVATAIFGSVKVEWAENRKSGRSMGFGGGEDGEALLPLCFRKKGPGHDTISTFLEPDRSWRYQHEPSLQVDSWTGNGSAMLGPSLGPLGKPSGRRRAPDE